MITAMLRYSATAVAYVTAYGTPGRVDMGNVGLDIEKKGGAGHGTSRTPQADTKESLGGRESIRAAMGLSKRHPRGWRMDSQLRLAYNLSRSASPTADP